MTVKQLQEKLSKMPQDVEVKMEVAYYDAELSETWNKKLKEGPIDGVFTVISPTCKYVALRNLLP